MSLKFYYIFVSSDVCCVLLSRDSTPPSLLHYVTENIVTQNVFSH